MQDSSFPLFTLPLELVSLTLERHYSLWDVAHLKMTENELKYLREYKVLSRFRANVTVPCPSKATVYCASQGHLLCLDRARVDIKTTEDLLESTHQTILKSLDNIALPIYWKESGNRFSSNFLLDISKQNRENEMSVIYGCFLMFAMIHGDRQLFEKMKAHDYLFSIRDVAFAIASGNADSVQYTFAEIAGQRLYIDAKHLLFQAAVQFRGKITDVETKLEAIHQIRRHTKMNKMDIASNDSMMDKALLYKAYNLFNRLACDEKRIDSSTQLIILNENGLGFSINPSVEVRRKFGDLSNIKVYQFVARYGTPEQLSETIVLMRLSITKDMFDEKTYDLASYVRVRRENVAVLISHVNKRKFGWDD